MLRVVVREDHSFEMISDLIQDMKRVIEWLDHHFIYTGAGTLTSHAAHSVMVAANHMHEHLKVTIHCRHS